MSDLNYLSQLTGNIGVLLGEASGNLCSIDVDSDEGFTAFLTLNPSFKRHSKLGVHAAVTSGFVSMGVTRR